MESESAQLSEIRHEVRNGVLYVLLRGRIGPNLVVNHALAHREIFVAHRRLFYDFRKLDVSALTTESLVQLPAAFRPIHEFRDSAHVALVVPEELLELAGVLKAIYESSDAPVTLAVFQDPEDAERWLESANGCDSDKQRLQL